MSRRNYFFILLLLVSAITVSAVSDVEIVKLDDQDSEIWSRTYGGSSDDYPFSVQEVKDGYVVVGYSESFSAMGDIWLLKLDPAGLLEWDMVYGGEDVDFAYSIEQTSDQGFIIGATTTSSGAGKNDYYLIKTDSNGVIEWEKTFGGAEDDTAFSAQETAEGDFIIVGYTESFGEDFWIVQTDPQGNFRSETFGGDAETVSVTETVDGGFVIAGYSGDYGQGVRDFWIINIQGVFTTSIGPAIENAHSLQATADGGQIEAKSTLAVGDQFTIIKLKSGCQPNWQLTGSWSACTNNVQYQNYYDKNNCAGSTAPLPLSQSCGTSSGGSSSGGGGGGGSIPSFFIEEEEIEGQTPVEPFEEFAAEETEEILPEPGIREDSGRAPPITGLAISGEPGTGGGGTIVSFLLSVVLLGQFFGYIIFNKFA
ncbi:hypothetical protein GOV09_04780 [Candidatus Woesearchaeota archaeon]|nr:hypothetical protein [Candidatus Woesearchaeota archaeon]